MANRLHSPSISSLTKGSKRNGNYDADAYYTRGIAVLQMTGTELKHIREAKGWTLAQMGLALGYKYDPALACWRLENEYQGRKVPEWRASKARELSK